MAQTLLLGLGGTGSRIVDYVAAELQKRRVKINDGQICCAVLDTNDNDRTKLAKSGTQIPIIPTSKDRIIDSYIKMYANKNVLDWMPDSQALRKESMKDGASQMRTKSRLAFVDVLEDGTIRQLENLISQLFNNRDDAKIRVMVVSSLAGGTGSGMFIQTALWLRKFFAKRKCAVTIRGIFVLPDVFIKTIKDIESDNMEIQSLYANAYGAIRELNAITQIKTKGMVPRRPVKIGDLFDSEKGQPDGQPVYDYAFFIDDISEGGSVLTQIDHYEQVAARLVYMQLYAPMHDDLYSEEDNLFKRFQKSPEPVYGSCGTAKAVYPSEDILRYCALRAAQDSLSTGWRKIDEEIRIKQRKEAEKEKSGVILEHRLNPRSEYVRLFEAKCAKTGKQIGSDRLFITIANDVKNESRVPGENGEDTVYYSDKVSDLIEKMDTLIAEVVDTADPGNLRSLKLKKAWAEQTSDTKETLIALVEKKEKDVERFLRAMEESAASLADEMLDLVCPFDMGEINPENPASVFGFLTKKNNNNESCFVHPVAVRYLLYRLATYLEGVKAEINVERAYMCAQKGYGDGKQKINFDNPRTGKVEDDAIAYLNSKALFQSEEKFIGTFKKLYAQHNAGQVELCRVYAINSVKLQLAITLSQRLEKLICIVEDFFKNLVKVSNSLDDAVAENIRKNSRMDQKIIYVCASEEEKKMLYQSLGFNTGNSEAGVNGMIVRSLYGQLCAAENPEAENNAKYRGVSVEDSFFREIISTYSTLILAKHRDDIDVDLYTAVCKSSDIEFEKAQAAAEKIDSDRLSVDLETGESLEGNARHQRHVTAMSELVDHLYALGAPFLISNDEQPEDGNEHLQDASDEEEYTVFTPIKKRKTFWGFHPALAEKCPELANILGVNLRLQQNAAYAKNELDCYRAVYGIQAGYIEKFNELNDGAYYVNYRQVVREMIASESAGDPTGLISTPHLDKTWHHFLPYITAEKQKQEDEKFYRLFWLALAYGMVFLDANGKYMVNRRKTTVSGAYEQAEFVIHNGKQIGKVDIPKLLDALRSDATFMIDAAVLEKKFAEECDELDNYEGTEFLRGRVVKETKRKADGETVKSTVGGLASKQDNNAVTVIVRHFHAPRHEDSETVTMIQVLEKLCRELVSYRYQGSEQDKVQLKGYALCKRIYEASALRDKEIAPIKHWKDAWSASSFEE